MGFRLRDTLKTVEDSPFVQFLRRWARARQFARTNRALDRLIAERNARDEARMGASVWPREPFTGIRWRRMRDGAGDAQVAWLGQDGVCITDVVIGLRDKAPPDIWVLGGDVPEPKRWNEIRALLTYDLALETIGETLWKDEDV